MPSLQTWLRILVLSILATTLSSAADTLYPLGSNWRQVKWDRFGSYPSPLNDDGSYHFTVYQGQFAWLTVTDGGIAWEKIEVLNHGVRLAVTTSFGNTDSNYRAGSFDSAYGDQTYGHINIPLPAGSYKLTFRVLSGKLGVYDDLILPEIYAAFRIELYPTTPDVDRDGVTDIWETGTGVFVSPVDTGSSPNEADTDHDGLSDGTEVFATLSDPNKVDTDGDGFTDKAEVEAGKSPIDPDSKPLLLDIRTAVELTIGTEIGKSYQVEWSADLVTWQAFPEIIAGDGNPLTRFYSTKNHPARYFRTTLVPTP